MKDDGTVIFHECPKCDNICFKGVDVGLTYWLSTLTVPYSDAKVLFDWGIPIYIIRKPGRKIYAEHWSGGKDPGQWLVIQHECTRDKLNWQSHKPDYSIVPPKKRNMVPPPIFED